MTKATHKRQSLIEFKEFQSIGQNEGMATGGLKQHLGAHILVQKQEAESTL